MASDRLSPAGGADGVTLALGVREGEGVGEGGRGLLLALPSAVGTNATDCVGAALELGVTDALLVTAAVPWVVHMQLHTVSHVGAGEGDSDPLVPVRDEEELAPRDGVLETEPTLFEGVALTLLPAEWDATPPLATGASDGVEYVGVADGVIDSDGEVDVAEAADKVTRSWEPMLSKLARNGQHRPYSHSMVPGGLLVISITTRFTPFTSLTMRLEIFSIRS